MIFLQSELRKIWSKKPKSKGILYEKGVCLVFDYYSWVNGLCGDLEITITVGVVIDELLEGQILFLNVRYYNRRVYGYIFCFFL